MATIVDHFKLVADKSSTFSTAITEIAGVNGILEELIANDLALVKAFGGPGDPIVEFDTENFKQAVREAVISSKGVISAIKSVAKYGSNADHIQRIKEDLNIPQLEDDSETLSGQKLRDYLTVISQRVSNCHKRMEVVRPLYEKVHSVMLQRVHPPAEESFTAVSVPRVVFIGKMAGVAALTLLFPVLINYIQLSDGPPLYILGILCFGCGIVCLGYLFLNRGQRDRERNMPQPLAPPIAEVVDPQSAGVAVLAFLAKLENFKSQLLDLEECMKEAAKCQNCGNIREIEEQLQKMQVDMESILVAASDVA